MKTKSISKNPTKIINHKCSSPTQDKIYGENRRLANVTKKHPGNIYRCTICGELE